jgi:hypothetical protein
MLNETLLTKEIRQWSKDVLEKPNKKFNNLPACPFSEHTWSKDKVRVVLGKGGNWNDLIEIIENFDDTHDVVVYCGTDIDCISAEEVEDRLRNLNEYLCKLDLYVMGSHPEEDEIEHAGSQENFEPIFEEAYYTVYLQRLSILVKASDSIIKKGYYKNYSSNVMKKINNRRKLWKRKRTL